MKLADGIKEQDVEKAFTGQSRAWIRQTDWVLLGIWHSRPGLYVGDYESADWLVGSLPQDAKFQSFRLDKAADMQDIFVDFDNGYVRILVGQLSSSYRNWATFKLTPEQLEELKPRLLKFSRFWQFMNPDEPFWMCWRPL